MGKTLTEVFQDLANFYQQQVDEKDAEGFAQLFQIVSDAFLKQLADAGFTATDVEYLDGYFIFGFGSNSVLHFHIKECPGWKFGVWWAKPEKPDQQYVSGTWFAQFEEIIDKFKPSASTYSETVYVRDHDTGLSYGAQCSLEFIRDEPYLAFCRDYCYWNYNHEYHTREEAEAEYHKYVNHKNLEEQANAEYTEAVKHEMIELLKRNMEEGDEIYLYDRGDWISPSLEFFVYSPNGEETDVHCSDLDGYEEMVSHLKAIEDKYSKDIYVSHWIVSEWITIITKQPEPSDHMKKVS